MPTATTVPVKMAQRRDTAANWTSANPTLLAGEIGIEFLQGLGWPSRPTPH